MTKIRISGISDLADARAASALGVDFIGLNLTMGDPFALSPIKVHDYLQWLTGVEVVAQTHHLDIEKALRFAELLDLKWIEIDASRTDGQEIPKKVWLRYQGTLSQQKTAQNIYLTGADKLPESFEGNRKNVFIESGNGVSDREILEAGYSVNLKVDDFKTTEGTDWDALGKRVDLFLPSNA